MRNRVEIKKKMDTEIFPIFKNRLSGQAKKKAKHGQSRKKHKIVKKTWKSGKKIEKPLPVPVTGTGTLGAG